MIPTMLLVGLVVGRWWVIPLGALGWAVLLLATGPLGAGEILAAGVLGAANTAIGVLVRRLGSRALRRALSATRFKRAA